MGIQLDLFGFLPPEKRESKLPERKKKRESVSYNFEYLILISPDVIVKQRVKELKVKLNQKIKLSDENLRSIPHLSLMLYGSNDMQDEIVVSKINAALQNEVSFRIDLNKASFFQHGNTNDVILKVENPEPVKRIFKCLMPQFFPGRIHSGFVPHVTIGRKIERQEFQKIASSLEEFDLKASFICNSISVFRRKITGVGKTKYQNIYDKKLKE